MDVEFRLPDIGEGIATAEIVEWHVEVGQRVKEFDPMVDVQTDKAIVAIPCPVDGVVSRLAAESEAILNVGDVIIAFAEVSEAQAAVLQAASHGPGSAEPPAETPQAGDWADRIDAAHRPHHGVTRGPKAGPADRRRSCRGNR